jgi:membrane associated rhomboid family serine protease
MDREPGPAFPPPPPTTERCYRHPDVETGVHCTRCSKPICPACMIPAPVGHHCPDCVAEAKREFRQGPGRKMALAKVRGASATTILLAGIVAVYVLEIATGGVGRLFEGPGVLRLIDLGASIGVAELPDGRLVGIATGQWWRLGSAMFLHAGILHLAMNAWGLYLFGNVEEQEVGTLRFVLIYLVSGLVAGAASYAFAETPFGVGVGASGAIYGLLGAFVSYNWRRRHLAFFRARLSSVMPWIVLNLVLSFSISFIDWRAHVGGLLAGGVAGFVAEGTGSASQRRMILIAGFAGLLALAVGLVMWRTAQLRDQFPGIV